jgi:threonyl-tRNA synthetase
MSAARGYQEIKTPLLYDSELWKTSGHWDKYREHMFLTQSEDKPMGLKPMNCPGHCAFYGDGQALLPRAADPLLGARPLHRNEPSGTLHGCCGCATSSRTTRTSSAPTTRSSRRSSTASSSASRGTTRSGSTCDRALDAARAADRLRGELGPREAALAAALEKGGYEYELHEGDGAFYGPKIDLHMRDSLKRSWQLGTVQLDFTFPERFDLTYTGADNAEHQPAMIHRALVGSFERLHRDPARAHRRRPAAVARAGPGRGPPAGRPPQRLRRRGGGRPACGGLRADVDDAPESVGRKIREAELRKVPYMLVVGDREAEERAVSLRRHGEGDLGTVTLDEVVERLAEEADGRDGNEAILRHVDQAF